MAEAVAEAKTSGLEDVFGKELTYSQEITKDSDSDEDTVDRKETTIVLAEDGSCIHRDITEIGSLGTKKVISKPGKWDRTSDDIVTATVADRGTFTYTISTKEIKKA